MPKPVSLEETYADEPTAKAGALTIDPSDAKALDDFVRHISVRCYDEFQERSGSKSRELRLHLERMRELLDKLLDYPKLGIELYCLDTRDIQAEGVDASLLSEVAGRAGLHFHEIDVYQLPDDIPFGMPQIAVNAERLGDVCRSFERQRQDLLQQYGEKDDAGKLKVNAEGMITVADMEAFNAAMSDHRDLEVSVDLATVPLDKMPNEIEVDLTAKLMPMISSG